MKLFTGLLQPTFQEGTGSFVSGGPYGPEGELFILDFNCQPLGRVPICFMSVGPYGPGGVLSHFEGEGGFSLGPVRAPRHETTGTLLKSWL